MLTHEVRAFKCDQKITVTYVRFMHFFPLLCWYTCLLYMLTISAILDCQFYFWQIKRLYYVQTDIFIKSIFVYLWTIKQFTRHCILYVVLNTLGCLWTLNSMLYCVFHIAYVFFRHLNNLIARNQHYFWKTYENV